MTGHSTRDRILDEAQFLVQQRGYASVAYRDISAALGIRNASVHHHFPAKADLGHALVSRYRARTAAALAQLSAAEPSPLARLRQYVAAYHGVVHPDGRICLCAQLVAETTVLAPAIQQEIAAFFSASGAWLAATLAEGQRRGELSLPDDPAQTAQSLLATVQGAMFLARAARDPHRFHDVAGRAVSALCAPTPRSR